MQAQTPTRLVGIVAFGEGYEALRPRLGQLRKAGFALMFASRRRRAVDIVERLREVQANGGRAGLLVAVTSRVFKRNKAQWAAIHGAVNAGIRVVAVPVSRERPLNGHADALLDIGKLGRYRVTFDRVRPSGEKAVLRWHRNSWGWELTRETDTSGTWAARVSRLAPSAVLDGSKTQALRDEYDFLECRVRAALDELSYVEGDGFQLLTDGYGFADDDLNPDWDVGPEDAQERRRERALDYRVEDFRYADPGDGQDVYAELDKACLQGTL